MLRSRQLRVAGRTAWWPRSPRPKIRIRSRRNGGGHRERGADRSHHARLGATGYTARARRQLEGRVRHIPLLGPWPLLQPAGGGHPRAAEQPQQRSLRGRQSQPPSAGRKDKSRHSQHLRYGRAQSRQSLGRRGGQPGGQRAGGRGRKPVPATRHERPGAHREGRCHIVERRTREFCVPNIFKRPRLPRATCS